MLAFMRGRAEGRFATLVLLCALACRGDPLSNTIRSPDSAVAPDIAPSPSMVDSGNSSDHPGNRPEGPGAALAGPCGPRPDFSAPPYTPGTVACGGLMCATAGGCVYDSMLPGRRCGPCDSCSVARGLFCDGPEDCKAGESCWTFEWARCYDETAAADFRGTSVRRLCHTDADCPCTHECRATCVPRL